MDIHFSSTNFHPTKITLGGTSDNFHADLMQSFRVRKPVMTGVMPKLWSLRARIRLCQSMVRHADYTSVDKACCLLVQRAVLI